MLDDEGLVNRRSPGDAVDGRYAEQMAASYDVFCLFIGSAGGGCMKEMVLFQKLRHRGINLIFWKNLSWLTKEKLSEKHQ